MTNLICAVIVTLATNWVTVSRTVPVLGNPTWAVHVNAMLNQAGQRVTNYVALVAWKGRTNEVVLESVADAAQEPLFRSIPESNGAGLFVNPAVITDSPVIRYDPVLHWETQAPPNWTPLPDGIGWHVEN